MGFRHKIFKIFYLTVFLLVVFSFSSNNSKVRAAVASCPTVINTTNTDNPEGLAVSTYIGNWNNNTPVRDVYHNKKNNTSEAFAMNIIATNTTLYKNGSSSGIEEVKNDGNWTWLESLTSADLKVINSNPNCEINGVDIAYNDFVMLPWRGWDLYCGTAAKKPVQFTVKIDGPAPHGQNPDGTWYYKNPGGKWYYINTALSSVGNLQANTHAQGGSFTFNYSDNPSFINGNTSNIYAYYIEPNYDLSTITTVATSGATGSSPQTVNANVGTNVSYYLQSSFANKANIATAFHYNIQDQFELVHNGVSYYENIGANTQTLLPDSVIGSINSGIKWDTNPSVTIPYTFTDNKGQTITLANGDQFCMDLLTSSAADAPFARSSNNRACANVTVPPVLTPPVLTPPVLTCSNSDNQEETGFNGPIGYTVTNNNSTPITYGVNASINSLTSLSITPSNSIQVTSNSPVNGTVSFGTPLPIGQYTLKINLTDNGNQVATVNCGVNVTNPPVLTCSNSDNQEETGFNGPIGYTVTNNNSTPITYGVNASINSLTSLSITPSNSIQVTSNSPVNGTVSFGTPLPIGQYTLKINLTDNGNQVASVNCGLNIVLRPYFKVYGGGVMTGSNFMNSNGTCTNNTSANIVAFNNGTNGSSTDQAIFSSGYVYGMGSQQSTESSGTSLLTFANTPNTIFGNSGAIGGSFEGIQCMPDYYSQLKQFASVDNTDSSPNINSFNQGVNIYTGGDVKISGNITLTNTITSAGLPFMYIIAYGHDIYINNTVNEVDAVLIAEPNNGSGGNIYTCEDNIQNNAFSSCKNKPLTIKGALLASQVHLLRTGSNNSTASSSVNATGGCETSFNGAEQICMSPLYWLTNPFSEITNTTTTTTDYIQQLPPTL